MTLPPRRRVPPVPGRGAPGFTLTVLPLASLLAPWLAPRDPRAQDNRRGAAAHSLGGIIIESSLSFVGLGVSGGAITWGTPLSDARDQVAMCSIRGCTLECFRRTE